jgi:hypothetical protein
MGFDWWVGAKWKEQIVSNGRDVHGVLRFGVFRAPAFAMCGGARPAASGCDGRESTQHLRLEALEFLERAIWIRARSVTKCLE